MTEFGRHARALLGLLLLNTRAIEKFDPSPEAARRALQLLWLIIPLRLFAGWVAERQLGPDSLLEYVLVRGMQTGAAVALPLPFIWLFCRQQGLGARFWLFMTTYLWLALFWAAYSALANGLTMNTMFTLETIKAVGTTLFFISYAASSYFAWLALRCNLFVAIGVATVVGLCTAITSDTASLYLFGSARPLIGE